MLGVNNQFLFSFNKFLSGLSRLFVYSTKKDILKESKSLTELRFLEAEGGKWIIFYVAGNLNNPFLLF